METKTVVDWSSVFFWVLLFTLSVFIDCLPLLVALAAGM